MLSYPPILRGLIALLIAGVAFPLTGVLVVRMNLITLRFALMHTALLGGALGLALGVDTTAATVVLAVAIVIVIGRIARGTGAGLGPVTMMIMALTVAGAAALTYRAGVPARDTLAILWGNVYALEPRDLWTTTGFSALLVAAVWGLRPQLTAMMFSAEITRVSGRNESALYYGVLLGIALTVGIAMRLVGALLLDVLLLLPALVAGRVARSVRSLLLIAMLAGLVSSAGGFALSLAADLPASAGVAAVSVVLLAATTIIPHRRTS